MKTLRVLIAAFLIGLIAIACVQAPVAPPPLAVPAMRPVLATYLASSDFEKADLEMRGWLGAHPDDSEVRFSLGAVQLFDGLEHLGRSLYRFGLKNNFLTNLFPIFRLPIPTNPNPDVIAYTDLQSILQRWVDDLAKVQATLALVKDPNVKLPIALGTVHLDLNGDRKTEPNEAFWKIYADVTRNPVTEQEAAKFTIAFDGADVLWLRGYTHLMAAFGDLLLSYDRREIFEDCAHLFFAKVKTPHAFLANSSTTSSLNSTTETLDAIAGLHLLRFPVADAQRMTVVLEHLRAMLSLGRQSWQLILAETDSDREWIPSPKQKGVIPNISVTQDMVDSWLGFLNEAEQLLAGKKLVPFWRTVDSGVGINLQRVFTEPRILDVILWVQGTAATPYLEKGTLTDSGVWERLLRAFGGDLLGFAIWFN